MDTETLVARLEACTLDPAAFSHRNHVRAAWHYLNRLPLREAAFRFADVLHAYVRKLGADDKFHLTLTLAFMHLIHRPMREGECWNEFAARNPALFDKAMSLIAEHYRPATLEQGRREFVEPDLAELP